MRIERLVRLWASLFVATSMGAFNSVQVASCIDFHRGRWEMMRIGGERSRMRVGGGGERGGLISSAFPPSTLAKRDSPAFASAKSVKGDIYSSKTIDRPNSASARGRERRRVSFTQRSAFRVSIDAFSFKHPSSAVANGNTSTFTVRWRLR